MNERVSEFVGGSGIVVLCDAHTILFLFTDKISY
jgi:hypothetical protein